MTDFADITDERVNILSELAAGNPLPLARWLEEGGDLKDDQRALLTSFLRGGIKAKRGQRRTYSDKAAARDIRTELQVLQRQFAIRDGSAKSWTKAIKAYHDIHPEMSFEKIRSYAKRGLWPKSFLEALDRVREAILKG